MQPSSQIGTNGNAALEEEPTGGISRARAHARPARTTRAWRPADPWASHPLILRTHARGESPEQRLYEITIPNLSLETEFATVRRRLLADFPAVLEVFATRAPGTLLIAYGGEDEVDAWCAALSDAVAARRRSPATRAGATAAADRRLEGALEGAGSAARAAGGGELT
jgi:hypothetical protein